MIAEFLFKNPRILVLTIVVIVASGGSSFYVLPRLEDPVLRKRVAVVSTVYPGADVQQVESLVTIPMEEQLTSIAEINQVRSNSRTGMSNLVIELKDDVYDVEPVWSRVRTRIADASEHLPESCFRPELEVFPLKAFAAIVAIRWSGDGQPNRFILRRLAKSLRAALLEISGTEQVQTFGDPGEEYVAEIAPSTLMATGLSTAAIAQQVASSRATQPSGNLPGAEAELLLDLVDTTLPLTRIADALITYGRGETVPLSRIAKIEKRLIDPAENMALIDGQSVIVLGAFVSDEIRVDQWSRELDHALERFQSEHKHEVAIDLLFSQRRHVDDRMRNLLQNLALGTAAVVLVVLFLMGWRSMLVVGTALPLSALIVFSGMRLLAIPIHQMSVTGVILALGLLIDNAIVIVEEVRSRIVLGAAASEAIRQSVRHLAMPLFGSTITTALAFLPIATLPGPSGEFVGTLAVSVVLAISASFILSMTVIPALICLLRIDPAARGAFSYGLTFSSASTLYERSLLWVFRFPVVGVVLGLILPLIGFAAALKLPQQFFPASDRPQIQIEVERPARDSLEATRKSVDAVRRIVREDRRTVRQYWFLGGSAPTFYYNVVPRRRRAPSYAQAFVDVRGGEAIDQVVRDLQNAIDNRVFDSRVIVRQLEQGPPYDAPIEIRLAGPDLMTLQRLGSELRLLLSQTANVIQTRSDLEETIPQLALQLDQRTAKALGLTEAQIAAQLYTTLQGSPAGSVYDGGQELPVSVKLVFGAHSKLELLAALQLVAPQRRPSMGESPGGPSNPQAVANQNPTLGSVSEFRLEPAVGSILRVDGHRVNEVKAYVQAGVLPSVVLDQFKRRLSASEFSLPSGYSLEFGGEAEKRSHAVNSLIANAVVLFALMLLTLVASFRSFRCAFVIAVVGGLSVGLGPLSLSLFGYPFGFMAIVGTMGLIGVAINDSIVVLAGIRASAPARDGDVEALAKVVSGCTRHIVATTLTTIVGFLPLILAGGGFWPPLAITIAGGVGGATLMALYFVPALHLLLVGRRNAAATW